MQYEFHRDAVTVLDIYQLARWHRAMREPSIILIILSPRKFGRETRVKKMAVHRHLDG
jgi:hypothetical protein